jgi:dolichyl-diphosphooligosaccharide--protein glycosyltransferase
MTLPYSTTGYGEYGPENGYTNVSVRATGPYTVSTPGELVEIDGNASVEQYRATVDVSEGQVNGDREGPIDVTLERETSELTLGAVDGEGEVGESANQRGSADGSDGGAATAATGRSDAPGERVGASSVPAAPARHAPVSPAARPSVAR